MENIIGFALCIVAALSSKNRELPVIICCYYAAYFLLGSQYIDVLPGNIQHIFNSVDLYLTYTMISGCVIAACVFFAMIGAKKAYWLIGYGVITFIFLLADAFQAVAEAAGGYNWMLLTHSFLQGFAVPLDLLFAWCGADNAVTRKLFGDMRDNVSVDTHHGFFVDHGNDKVTKA